MKKIKKLLAMIMAMTMVLGLGLTSFAANQEGTITITNAGEGTFVAVQVVKEDPTKVTGWEIVDAYKNAFTEAFEEEDTQIIIKGMIASVAENPVEADKISEFDSKYQSALEMVVNSIKADTEGAVTATASNDKADLKLTAQAPNTVAGVWAIDGEEEGFNYSAMAAYIGFEAENNNATVNAKKAPTTIEKDRNTEDVTVEIGETVGYTVKSRVPYIPTGDTNRTYKITDTLTGGTYAVETEGPNVDKLKVTVVLKAFEDAQSSDPANYKTFDKYVEVTNGTDNATFTLGLTNELLKEGGASDGKPANTYHNWIIEISYSAKVTGTKIDNEIQAGEPGADGKPEFGSDHEYLISGTATLTKTGEGEDKDALKDAKFVLVKVTKSVNATDPEKFDYTYQYATVNPETGDLIGWVSEQDNATVLTTNVAGQITVNGLDPQNTEVADAACTYYEFKEIEAPDGYSVNDDNANITWSVIPSSVDETTRPVNGTAKMADTKLASLPSTGGIGTTIFTIGGCAIMIAAAALYFVNRRKSEEN